MAAKPLSATPLKKVHEQAKNAMPLVTAFITTLGFVATLLETRHIAKEEVATQTTTDQDGKPVTIITLAQPSAMTLLFGTAGVLTRYLLGTLIGLTIIALLVATAVVGGKVWMAVILTALVLTALWLASTKFARRYARKVR